MSALTILEGKTRPIAQINKAFLLGWAFVVWGCGASGTLGIGRRELADDTVMRAYEASGITVTAGESMFAGGGLYFVYLLGGLSILTIVAAEVRSALK